uniref:pentatricopeptide repeat-containing protein At4g18840 n=1 Tax=Erigeron canadensis TaxID=72917 RepID=UPI001CB8E4B5|nr:pentatricopeptide repeat-containing protein At4g18840 [Erigeron canadensis]XP_043621742.1 pentatricopeptide repeat-containing protein At4g18840 [Erigeron canadensis]
MATNFFPPPITSISELRQSHAHFIKTGLISDPFSAGRLISSATAVSPPHSLSYAHSIFTHLENPNSYSYNALIRAYANSPTPETSFDLFIKMLFDFKVDPDKYTYTFVLKACAAAKSVGFGKQVHGLVIKCGVDDDVYVCNTLIHMYAKGGFFEIARKVLDEMSERDVISWNAILSAYVDMGMMELARRLFDEMPERNVESGNFMISGYVKDGLVVEARRIFDGMLVKDVVSWNGIITGYARDGDFDEVFRLFEDMRKAGMVPDDYTLVNVLSCCASVSGLNQGEWVHGYIDKNGIEVGGFLATALVDMYSKCGCLDKALEVFHETKNKDISTWNSMITGLGLHGFGEPALELFHKLVAEGLKPNEVTFVGILSACSRSGLLDEGCNMFELMVHTHKIKPTIEHYGCMVDLLGRFGLLNEAEKLAKEVPFEEAQIVWESLLGACRSHNDVEMAERVTKKLLELDPQDSAGYVQLSNVHAYKGRFSDAIELRRKMKAQGVYKAPGCSMIEVDGTVHQFLAGEGMVL